MNPFSIVTMICTAYYTTTRRSIAKNTMIASFNRVINTSITFVKNSNAFCAVNEKFSPGENFKYNHLLVLFSI